MSDLGLRPKFNILLFVVFAAGFGAVHVTAERFLLARAKDEVRGNAMLAMETVSVTPADGTETAQLARMSRIKSAFQTLDYRVLPATPTSIGTVLPDLPDLAARFKAQGAPTELSGEIGKNGARRYYLARPIRDANGQVSGVRLVTLGTQFYVHDAERALYTLMGSMLGIFVIVFIMLNILLDRMIIRPIAQIAKTADEISVGNLDLPEIKPESRDEIGVLVVAFNRLRRSTEEAIRMLKAL
ncbi:MAG: HAMP domain-containing protein [Betaproteobacteria bacterium]|nr:HAMP domain-containing protein [Betaproteobacteria bacterium]